MTEEQLPYKFSFSITYKEYKSLTLAHSKNQLIFIGVFIFVVFIATTWIKSSNFDVMLSKAPIGIILSLVLTFFMWLLTLYKSRRAFETSGILKSEQTLTLSEDGIQMAIETNDSLIPWNEVAKVSESKDLFIIYLTKNQGVLIPRSAVEMARIRPILRSFLDSSKLRIK
ncbi:hypothetical protein DMN77_06200 [Paenibacillus sp. 79R4]|uniref:YcxB family protein n=1 Tax=Paenibacillus sp. 79R4 TaxID=2212847 RepID=UPI0015B9BACE|nr:YcxB family protein [Paenibacillus sp. 79R4]NWL87193.1 hypothetical protein [Paenibacillus sp. 79R4]